MSKILCRILLLIVIIAIEIVCAQGSCFCYHCIAESEEEGIIVLLRVRRGSHCIAESEELRRI